MRKRVLAAAGTAIAVGVVATAYFWNQRESATTNFASLKIPFTADFDRLYGLSWAPNSETVLVETGSRSLNIDTSQKRLSAVKTSVSGQWLPDGKHIVTGGSNALTVTNMNGAMAGKKTTTAIPDDYAVTFGSSPDGNWIAVDDNFKLSVYKTGALNEPPRVLPNEGPFQFSPDTKLLATITDGDLNIWELPAFNKRFTIESNNAHAQTLQFSSDSKNLLWDSRARRFATVDLTTGKHHWIDDDATEDTIKHGAWITNTEFVTAGVDGLIRYWTSPATKPTKTLKIGKPLRHVSAKGQYLCVVTKTNTLEIWDQQTRKRLAHVNDVRYGGDHLEPCLWSPDGTQLATSSINTVYLWKSRP